VSSQKLGRRTNAAATKASALEGFVVDVKVGGVETVNCKATDTLYRDTRIEIADHLGARHQRNA
jgi:hypothetical protein